MNFDRLKKLIGEDSFKKIEQLNVMIIGLGGVGGYALESLARSGVNKFTLIDFDTVDITNINRQIIATEKTVGKYKVDLFYERLKEINSSVNVNIVREKVTLENIISIIDKYKPTFIIDACDDVKVKKALIKITTSKNINFISSMGTGKRIDPTKLEITTLDKTSYDPLARILRKYVKDERIKKKITVVASKEVPVKTSAKEIASCSFVPSTAGIFIASYVVDKTLKR